jgi:hypothetical protein
MLLQVVLPILLDIMMKNALFSLLLLLNLSLSAQSITLTTKEVMDFEVGDVFHYVFEYHTPTPNPEYGVMRKKVLSKSFNVDSSQVNYAIEISQYSRNTPSGNWTYYACDTINSVFTDLDSVCYSLFPPIGGFMYTFCSGIYEGVTYSQVIDTAYNNRVSLMGRSLYGYYRLKYAQGLGEVYKNYNSAFQTSCTEFSQMIYFKKGAIEFGTPDPTLLNATGIFAPEVYAYEALYLANERMLELKLLHFEEDMEIFISDMSGKVLLNQKVLSSNTQQLFPINHLSNGIYVVSLRTKNNYLSKKIAIMY